VADSLSRQVAAALAAVHATAYPARDGALVVSDDAGSCLWRIRYRGK